MALTDYANTLSRIKTAGDPSQDKKIIALYDEALKTFEMHLRCPRAGPRSELVHDLSNERLEGERGANQERALALVQKAIDLFEATPDEQLNRKDDLVVRTIASAYLAKSNIIRHREVGDPHESLLSALDALRAALGRLGSGQDDQLRGVIFFDLGHLNVELYSITRRTLTSTRRDVRLSASGGTPAEAFPRELSQALLGAAMIASEVPDLSSPAEIQRRESILAAEKALGLLEKNRMDPGSRQGPGLFGRTPRFA